MRFSTHQRKVLFTSATLTAALLYFLAGGVATAQDFDTVVSGDNILIVGGNNRSQNKFHIGAILKGSVDGTIDITSTTSVTHSTTADNPDPAVADILNDLLGENEEPVQTTTTVWQELTGAHRVTGVDDVEFGPAYTWARQHGITTTAFSSARLDSPILRYEFAKMMLAYIQNVEGKTLADNLQCDVRKYSDYHLMDASVRDVVQLACETGLMGWRSVVGVNQTITIPLAKFRPYDVMTEAEINIVANRYLPATVRLTPTNNTRSAVLRWMWSVAPQAPDMEE